MKKKSYRFVKSALMKLAFVSPVDASREIGHWSGTTYHLFHALTQHVEAIPLKVNADEPPRWLKHYYGVRRKLTGKQYKLGLHPRVLRQLARRAGDAALTVNADVVLAIGQGYLVFWEHPLPASFFSDTIYGSKVDFYRNWYRCRMDPLQLDQLAEFGQRAVDRADKVFLTSSFALQKAARELGTKVPAEKAYITLIGANLTKLPSEFQLHQPPPPVRLLWVGVDWSRKGGDDCLFVLNGLREAGVGAELHVVGCIPPVRHPNMVCHGFLDKGIVKERQELFDLYQQCHLFLFPSRADMSSAVCAEAAAFGLPIVTTKVGGIPELFAGDEAILLEPPRFREDAIQTILELLLRNRLQLMGHKARRRFETHLNWEVIARKIIGELESCLSSTTRSAEAKSWVNL